MGSSVHAPIQKNSLYVHTVRKYIYETRRYEHPHFPILRVQTVPPGTRLMSPLHVILPKKAWSTSIFTATSTVLATLTSSQSSQARLHVKNPYIDTSYLTQWAPSSSLADSIRITVFDWVWLMFSWLDSNQSFWLDSTQFTESIWLMALNVIRLTVLRFDLTHV